MLEDDCNNFILNLWSCPTSTITFKYHNRQESLLVTRVQKIQMLGRIKTQWANLNAVRLWVYNRIELTQLTLFISHSEMEK